MNRNQLVKAAVIGVGAAWLGSAAVRRYRRLGLAGRNVFITGGSRGLGLALAREFARHGARIAICARDPAELETAADDLRPISKVVKTYVCELRDPEQIAGVVRQAEQELGGIDILVNNAGTISVGPVETMKVEDFREAMDVNFWSALHTTMAVTPGMKARGGGRIVNIASVGGKMPVPHLLPYSASKFALVGLSTGLRAELMKDGIIVTTVNPGLMNTGSPRNANFKGNAEAEYAWFSLSDAMPGLAMSATSAARRIVRATRDGEAEITLSLPAKLGAKFYGLAPGWHAVAATLANALLPKDDHHRNVKKGRDSESGITRSILRFFGHRAEKRLNQLRN